jgi:tetratricopeptide (TPR) repeat protein
MAHDLQAAFRRLTLSMPGAILLMALIQPSLSGAIAVPGELPRGQVIDRVISKADPGQSYALYLPSFYDPGRRWPILFCFDPAARGRLPVELFRDAAEQYGYILAGSNNSRNGTAGQGPEAMRAMWNDAQARFTIDSACAFAAGMSGGARLVCGFAQQSDFLTGVIAFAAGFPQAHAPQSVPYLFFGAVGVDDFNFPELRQLDTELDRLGATKKIVAFDGGHGWPPSSVCTRAIEWLELQLMRIGKHPRDKEMVERLFEKEAASIRAAEAGGNVGEAYLLAKALAKDFAGFQNVSAFESKAAQLGASRQVKKYLQDEKDQQAVQYRREEELFARWEKRYEDADPDRASQSFASMLLELKRQSEAASDSSQRRIARRVLNGCYVSAYEESRSLFEQGSYRSSAHMLEMAVSIFPDRPQVLYALSSTYAKARDRKKALDALKRASDRGFRDATAVEADNAFEFLRDDPALKKILAEIREKQ